MLILNTYVKFRSCNFRACSRDSAIVLDFIVTVPYERTGTFSFSGASQTQTLFPAAGILLKYLERKGCCWEVVQLVVHQTLDLIILVRVQASQPNFSAI